MSKEKEYQETNIERHWRIDEENGGWIDMFASDAGDLVSGHMTFENVKRITIQYHGLDHWNSFLAYFRKYESTKSYKGDVQIAKEEGWTITPVAEILKANGIEP